MGSLIRNIYNYFFVDYRHKFNYDLGIDLIGKRLLHRYIIDTSKISDNLHIKFDSLGNVYQLSFDIKRPKENINKIKQRINLIRILQENMGLMAYQSKNLILKNNWIKIEKLGYSKILGNTNMDIKFYDDKISILLFNSELLSLNGDFEIVLKDYEDNKKVIDL